MEHGQIAIGVAMHAHTGFYIVATMAISRYLQDQPSVWKALLQIPPAAVVSYSRVATAIGRPGPARAVGRAVGANPIALLIPCHRVIQESGRLGGYHWGETRKHAIHAWESAQCE